MLARSIGDDDPAEDVERSIALVRDPGARGRLREEWTALREAVEGRRFHLVVFGTASAGKTSLMNALLGRSVGETSAVMGTTRLGEPQTLTIDGAEGTLLLTDTPGISAIGDGGTLGEAAAFELAVRADLLLFVVDHDLLRAESEALAALARRGKRAIVVLNKKDRLIEADLVDVLARLRERTAGLVPSADVVAVAADPRPVPVRVRLPDGTEQSVVEYEDPDLAELEARIEAILGAEGDDLRAGNLLLRGHLLRRSAREQLARQRRERAEAAIDRHQWMAATTAFAVPIPELDMIAAGAVEFRMVSEIAEVYGSDLSAEHVRMVSLQMIQALVGRRVVETAMTMIAGVFKSSLIGYAAGGLVQAVTIAYLTRITGRTFLEYFERGQDWGEGGMQAALARQIELNGRTEFLKQLLGQAADRLLRRRPPGPSRASSP